jgi:KDO2-lipid IV(A) lauroyltransferase
MMKADARPPKGRPTAFRNSLAGLVAGMPERKIKFFGEVLGDLLYLLLHLNRRITLRNLQFAYPQMGPVRARRVARQVFRHFATTLVEMLQMNSLSRQDCLKKVRVRGAHHLERAVLQNQGTIIISAHIGNWETALQFYPLFFEKPMLGVAKRFEYKVLDRWIHGFRSRFGNQMIYTKGALSDMTRTLRQGGAVGIMVDMNRQKKGVPVKFYGQYATATPAAALLALRCKSPVVPVFCHRGPDGGLVIRVSPPITMRRTGDLRKDLLVNTQRMTRAVEDVIRQHPEQWYWMQKRWKYFYPALYPEFFKTRRRRKLKRAQAKSLT